MRIERQVKVATTTDSDGDDEFVRAICEQWQIEFAGIAQRAKASAENITSPADVTTDSSDAPAAGVEPAEFADPRKAISVLASLAMTYRFLFFLFSRRAEAARLVLDGQPLKTSSPMTLHFEVENNRGDEDLE